MTASDQPPPKDIFASMVRALRARRLDRIAIGYAVAGWALVQAASIVLPSFDAAPWVLRATIILTLLGFPLVLAIAWFAAPHIYDVGARRRNLRGAHLAFALIALVVVAVVADLAYSLARIPAAPPTPNQVAVATGAAKNSIAVLPFVNMSGDPGKEYFSDGISEELLNDLANTPELVVAARTSSFAFKGKSENIKDIARILSVRSVLEGSIRESGQHIRITGQLIDASDGYHLWSATYDRDLTDVLVVQEEIAQAITTALTHKLLPRPAQMSAPKAAAIDAQAYDAYLLGNHQLAPRTQEGSEAALASFKTTTTRAPGFSDGFAALARAQIMVADFHPERSDLIPAAQASLARALQLDPRNVGALSARLEVSLHKLDWQASIADARAMEKTSPNSWPVQHEMFRFYWFMGFPDLAFAAASGAARLDPLSFVDRLNRTAFLLHSARFPEAIEAAKSALAIEHDQSLVLAMLCAAAAFNSDLTLAHATEAKLTAANAVFDTQYCRFDIAAAEHRTVEARAIVDRFAQSYPTGGSSALDLGEQYAIVGDYRKALYWLDRAYQKKEYVLFLLPSEKIVPPAFFETPEWQTFYRRPLFDDWRKAHDTVAADLAVHG